MISPLTECLLDVFKDESLFGFSPIDKNLSEKEKCKCSLVTLLPFPDLKYNYNAVEYFVMLEELRKIHSEKLRKIKEFFDAHKINYAAPSATPKDDGNYMADFSYKWAAIQAGLGFIGKNDVFVHYKYAQRVRISCMLIDFDIPISPVEIGSKCGDCNLCVQACPHGFISGRTWNTKIQRGDLLDYKKCATKSKYDGEGQKYSCAICSLACTYPEMKHTHLE